MILYDELTVQILSGSAPLSFSCFALFQEKAQHLILRLGIWSVTNWKVKPAGFLDNTSVMSKGIEALFPVIASHPGIPYASEAHFRGCNVNNGVINTPSSEGAFI